MGLVEHREAHYICHINKGINLHFCQEIKASDRHIHGEIEQGKKEREGERDREKKGGIYSGLQHIILSEKSEQMLQRVSERGIF